MSVVHTVSDVTVRSDDPKVPASSCLIHSYKGKLSDGTVFVYETTLVRGVVSGVPDRVDYDVVLGGKKYHNNLNLVPKAQMAEVSVLVNSVR